MRVGFGLIALITVLDIAAPDSDGSPYCKVAVRRSNRRVITENI